MAGKVYPTWIDCEAGRLFAIVHEPSPDVDNGAAILMPSAGQDSRVGPQRIYLKAAKRFVSEGFHVVRLDLSGVGDSVTRNPKIFLDSHSTKDVKAGVDWIRDSLNTENLFLVALCAGARVSIRYAAHDKSLSGLVAWSVPTLSEGDTPYLNASGVRRALGSGKLMTAAWWKNRLKYGHKEIAKVAVAALTGIAAKFGIKREPYFIRCMDKYIREGRPAQFIYGSLDKILCAEFAERFSSVPEGKSAKQCYWVVPEGVHTLATEDVQEAAIDMSADWLKMRIQAQSAPRKDAAITHRSAGSKYDNTEVLNTSP